MDQISDQKDQTVSFASDGNDDQQDIILQTEFQKAVNYASFQNSVPVVNRLTIENTTGESFANLELKLEFHPPFARTKIWRFESISPKDTISVQDCKIELDPAYLDKLNEAVTGELKFQLTSGQTTLMTRSDAIRVLARDEWGGFGPMASLISAFVMPNDPGIAPLLKRAADLLEQHGEVRALDGYQSRKPERSYMLAAALWSAIAELGLDYAEPPKSFESQGQKIRTPSRIRQEGLATCLDTTLLFASGLEAIGLNPVVVFQHGHAFVGVWLVNKTFPNLIETDPIEIRKALGARELVLFETTGVTQSPPVGFSHAVALARNAMSEAQETEFVGAVDIARARASQFHPMASFGASPGTDPSTATASHEKVAPPLPAVPDFFELPATISEEKPSTPQGRIERWQRKLLDLSLRNRLLNFRDTKQTVPIYCPDLPGLEDSLADHKKIKIVSLREHNPLDGRSDQIHLKTTGDNIDKEFALDMLEKNELCSPLTSKELNGRLITLTRLANSDMQEGGTNTLFLAIGFLRWKKTPDDERSYRAPLLLVPVKLKRIAASSVFKLEHHEDDVRFNETLVEMLKKDFNLNIGSFGGELPRDESGIDVPLIFEMIRRKVREVPGFEVLPEEAAISTFSFAKYLLWKDLVDRLDQLKHNRIVEHLIENPDKVFQPASSAPPPRQEELDQRYHPKALYCPLPADSSQLASIAAVKEGHDLILVGPPGTGKSQTIANMIAQCLADGKTVLFVAEKTAALEAVHRRLKQHGLGDYCLELHSSKTGRKPFLDQLKRSWIDRPQSVTGKWIEVNDKLKLHQDELNAYAEALHRKRPAGFSVYQAVSLISCSPDDYSPEPAWDEDTRHDAETYGRMCDLVRGAANSFSHVKPVPAFSCLRDFDWSINNEALLLKQAVNLVKMERYLKQSIEQFTSLLGYRLRSLSLSAIIENGQMAKIIAAVGGTGIAHYFAIPINQLEAEISKFDQLRTNIRSLEQQLGDKFQLEAVGDIPVGKLDEDWRQAKAVMWPKSIFTTRKVRKLLGTYATEDAELDLDRDLPVLDKLQKALVRLGAFPLLVKTGHYMQLDTDLDRIRKETELAKQLRKSIETAKLTKDEFASFKPVFLSHLKTANKGLVSAARKCTNAQQKFVEMLQIFKKIGGDFPFSPTTPNIFAEIEEFYRELHANHSALGAWSNWCKFVKAGKKAGIAPWLAAMEAGEIAPDQLLDRFRLGYARWWLPVEIGKDAVLSKFQHFQHEQVLKDFRDINNHARELAAREVQTKIRHGLPSPEQVPKRSELGLLRHQMNLIRPSKSIRFMVEAMPETFPKLAPCLLMSPLSIAQYLPSSQQLYDVVIFDEASQITTWDAIGAIARGKQTVIVGDPMQLPPTSFFGRSNDDEDDDDSTFFDADLESILDEAKASGIPTRSLRWHYRSRNESLITFSNHQYYENRLVTFPSTDNPDRAVKLIKVGGVYDRGKSKTNRMEAEAIIAECVKRMVEMLEWEEEERLTIGVVTFNNHQQSLILDLLDQARQQNPKLEWYFSDERLEPPFVKNIENVQGDERDIIMFSITFGKDAMGKITMNFGAINRDGGHRRLNVAVSRARCEMLVFSSLDPDLIDVSRVKAQGPKDLKLFLEYAARGSDVLFQQNQDSLGGYDSPFEEAVADALKENGWQIRTQIGASDFRIDLAIVHPEKPGRYLAGIECDGATYHGSATARDRDQVREAVLRNMGWQILRVWSTDWWYDAEDCTRRLDEQLNELLENSRLEDKAAKLRAEERKAAALERANTSPGPVAEG